MNRYDQPFMESLRTLPPIFGEAKLSSVVPLFGAMHPNVSRLLLVYRAVRPILLGTLRFIAAIPIIGARANRAIALLVTQLDALGHPGGEAYLTSVCHVYHYGRPLMVGILPSISTLPQIGGPASRALVTLLNALDAACNIASHPPGLNSGVSTVEPDGTFINKTACGCGCC
jgi:hypothetical protein